MQELKQIIMQMYLIIFAISLIYLILCKLSDFTKKYKSMKRKIIKYERILERENYESKKYYKNNNNKS